MSEPIHDLNDDTHDALSCPHCIGFAHSATVLGAFAEGMRKMLDDGVFERLGREMAERRNEAFWKAFLRGDGR